MKQLVLATFEDNNDEDDGEDTDGQLSLFAMMDLVTEEKPQQTWL